MEDYTWVKKKRDNGTLMPVSGEAILAVVAHYKSYHPRWNAGAKDTALIRQRFLDGYSLKDLKSAIDGIHIADWNCGRNPSGKKYQALSLCLRDSDHIERYMGEANCVTKPGFSERTQRTLNAAQHYLERKGIREQER